jgi:hypothetical protein
MKSQITNMNDTHEVQPTQKNSLNCRVSYLCLQEVTCFLCQDCAVFTKDGREWRVTLRYNFISSQAVT